MRKRYHRDFSTGLILVAPKDEVQAKALSIMRKGLAQTNTFGVGEIAFSGREHLVAIGAPLDPKQKGLMLYVLRYQDELRSTKSILSDVKESSVDADELSLAKQLIKAELRSWICPHTRMTTKLL